MYKEFCKKQKPPLPVSLEDGRKKSNKKAKNLGPLIRYEEIDETQLSPTDKVNKKQRRGFFESTIIYEEEVTPAKRKGYVNEVKPFKATNTNGMVIEASAMRSIRQLDKHIMTTLEVKKVTEKDARRKSIVAPLISIKELQ